MHQDPLLVPAFSAPRITALWQHGFAVDCILRLVMLSMATVASFFTKITTMNEMFLYFYSKFIEVCPWWSNQPRIGLDNVLVPNKIIIAKRVFFSYQIFYTLCGIICAPEENIISLLQSRDKHAMLWGKLFVMVMVRMCSPKIMASWHGNLLRITCALRVKSTGYRPIFRSKGQ